VSNFGRIKNGNGKEIHIRVSKKGYLSCRMVRESDGLERAMQLHRVVAMAFIPNPDGLPQINHCDGIKSNCMVSNLQWSTNGHNMAHAITNGLRPDYKKIYAAKEKKGRHKITNKAIVEIREAKISLNGKGGVKRSDLTKKYNVPLAFIKIIRAGLAYSYITWKDSL
jgi:hypothetical protein